MKKKGFTLIEIIVCIVLISIIGVSSFFGIKYIKNKAVVSELSKITDKAIQAANVYLETNKETYNQLYTNKNGVSLPLQLLVNEGLLNLDNTTLDDQDIKNQYVTTFLGGSGGSQNCEQITSVASWANSQPIYLCTNGDGESNLAIINPDSTNNYTKATREKYYFVGSYANNWIQLKNSTEKYRIIYVDTDDSLVLFTNNFTNIQAGTPFISELVNNTLPISLEGGVSSTIACPIAREKPVVMNTSYGHSYGDRNDMQESGISYITAEDILSTSLCKVATISPEGVSFYSSVYSAGLDTWMEHILDYSGNSSNNPTTISVPTSRISRVSYYHTKIHLKSCMKITSGTGDFANPFILENKCT